MPPSIQSCAEILTEMGFPQEKIKPVMHAIEAHSFSANIPAESDEARILQDADRMEALGALGVGAPAAAARVNSAAAFASSRPGACGT